MDSVLAWNHTQKSDCDSWGKTQLKIILKKHVPRQIQGFPYDSEDFSKVFPRFVTPFLWFWRCLSFTKDLVPRHPAAPVGLARRQRNLGIHVSTFVWIFLCAVCLNPRVSLLKTNFCWLFFNCSLVKPTKKTKHKHWGRELSFLWWFWVEW